MGFSVLSFINNIVLITLVSIPTCCSGENKNVQHVVMKQPQMVMVNGQPMYVVHQPPPGMMMQYQQPILQSSYPQQLQPQYLPAFTLNNPNNRPINNAAVSSSSVAMMPPGQLNQQTVPIVNNTTLNKEQLIQGENQN